MRVMVMLPGRRRLMLCASNHITVSRKLMFLAWSLLIRMLDSTLSTAPPVLCTGMMMGEMLGIFECVFFNNCWGDSAIFLIITRQERLVPDTLWICSNCMCLKDNSLNDMRAELLQSMDWHFYPCFSSIYNPNHEKAGISPFTADGKHLLWLHWLGFGQKQRFNP